ncbi:DUF417 family protein [Sphingobacterium suaedae]|uniref:DUF417 family protein n=1 Tax=Sphingobacterium suaedae TaxID=1686402 RepID=A0ABW5KJQ5_9SPHI
MDANFIGAIEIMTGLGRITFFRINRLDFSRFISVVTFLLTLSFLFTTPMDGKRGYFTH